MGISKHGNKYRRKLLIHGARAALPHVAERNTPLCLKVALRVHGTPRHATEIQLL
jgi:hypothetical protein